MIVYRMTARAVLSIIEKNHPFQFIGKNVLRMMTATAKAIAIPMTSLGLSLRDLSFSVSKYLTSPACDWNAPSFFFAML